MAVHNEDIAQIFDQIADLLEIEAENPFRVRAYRNAARTLRDLGKDIAGLLAEGEDLTRLPGIGKDLAGKIQEIVDSGHCATLDKLRKGVPADLPELLAMPGLGPKRVHALYHDLDIHNLQQLARAARDGRLRELPGFGPKLEARILETVAAHTQAPARLKRVTAAQYAEPLLAYLRRSKQVQQAEIAGSFRRARETVGDLDILVSTEKGADVIRHFVGYEEVAQITSQGNTRASVVLQSGLQVDLRAVTPESYGAALHYFTGSRAHNIAIRRIGQKHGLKINEYGVFKGRRRIAGETEASVFKAIGLPFIPPELRENRGEIEAAQAGKLPTLIELKDLRGDLHAHTDATDGHASLADMAKAARDRGLSYLAITDHSKRLTVAHGLDGKRLQQQIKAIDQLNRRLKGITLLKGIEVDILEDGTLDLPDEVLCQLDLVIGAVHSRFNLTRAQQTQRILRAMDHPCFTILAHPSGRLLNQREPYDVDMPRIIRHARERGCFLELNAHPERLDLLDTYCQLAREQGVLVSINSDAHSEAELDNLQFGIGQARRGWLGAKDVLNTRTLAQLRPLLKRAR